MKRSPGRSLPKSALMLLAALVNAGNEVPRPVRRADQADVDLLVAADLARLGPQGLIATEAGRAHVLRHSAANGSIDPFRAQHLSIARRLVATADGHADVAINEAESPLVWLARRKGRNGAPLIAVAQLQAGERLRADFTDAQLTPHVTSHWSASIARGRRGGHDRYGDFTVVTIAARQRLHRALDAVGPEFAGPLLDVCCFLKGLEDIERERRWPPRSAKVVVQLGLDCLARHYGLAHEARGPTRAPTRAWSDPDRETET